MTAICGFTQLEERRDGAAPCTLMRKALTMFGPHAEGQWDGGRTSLGIQKFHTLPEDIYDTQPLSDGRFVMVADIRLDNRPELASEFGWTEAECSRRADADFALAAWQKWEEGSFDKLIGEWSLAIWDRQEKTLTLARDMLGNRPLFWHKGVDEAGTPFFAFASMTQGLFALPAIKMAPNPDVLKFYLALAPMRGDGWFFKDIQRVLPGGVTVLHTDGSVDVHEWYDWSRLREVAVENEEACIREFRGLFDRAVQDCLRTNGSIACHLSSGFDSTAVATTAAKLLAKNDRRLAAYTHVPHKGWQTHVMRNRSADEGDIAAITASTCPNIDHHRIDSGDKEIGSDLAGSFYYAQIPMLNLCNLVWGNEITRIASKNGARVLLTGGMGNMTISQLGLEKQHDDFLHGRLLTWWRDMWVMKAHGFKIRGTLYRTFGRAMPAFLVNFLRRITGQRIQKMDVFSALHPKIARDADFQAEMKARNYDPYFRPHSSVREMAQFVLRRLDIHGVAHLMQLAQHGIDTRDPTRDRRLLEFSLTLPPRMWLKDGVTKWLYRQAFQGQVPDAVMHQKLHGQQGADWPERMRKGWDMLKMEAHPALDDAVVKELIDTDFYREMMEHPLPDEMTEELQTRYRIKFLRGLSVAHFIRKANMRN